jgi:hypothetical protein
MQLGGEIFTFRFIHRALPFFRRFREAFYRFSRSFSHFFRPFFFGVFPAFSLCFHEKTVSIPFILLFFYGIFLFIVILFAFIFPLFFSFLREKSRAFLLRRVRVKRERAFLYSYLSVSASLNASKGTVTA